MKPLDTEAVQEWVFPQTEDYPVREYQYNICKQALFHNTLVVLPTGLGKTLIASVVMYNFYKWYPSSLIVFCAPTRPLVTQQVDACYKIMGIPRSQTILLDGDVKPGDRESLYWNNNNIR